MATHCNESFFPGRVATMDVKLAALNLHDTSSAGGLTSAARVVTLPVGATILRLYRANPGGRADFGCWWFTPYELSRVADYFGVDAQLLVVGRSGGKSGLHGALALLSEWYNGDPGQLAAFHRATIRTPMYAYYGEGDVASTQGYGRVLKPLRLPDGAGGQAAPRQLYLPEPWTYQSEFALAAGGGNTDHELAAFVQGGNWMKLPFE